MCVIWILYGSTEGFYLSVLLSSRYIDKVPFL
jgi:hypothetical protein